MAKTQMDKTIEMQDLGHCSLVLPSENVCAASQSSFSPLLLGEN